MNDQMNNSTFKGKDLLIAILIIIIILLIFVLGYVVITNKNSNNNLNEPTNGENNTSTTIDEQNNTQIINDKVKANQTAICSVPYKNVYGSGSVSINDCMQYYDETSITNPSIFYIEDGKVYYGNIKENKVYQLGQNINDKVTSFLLWSPYIGMAEYTGTYFIIMKTDKNEVYYQMDGDSAKKINNSEDTIKIEILDSNNPFTPSHFKFTKSNGNEFYYNRPLNWSSEELENANTLNTNKTYDEVISELELN